MNNLTRRNIRYICFRLQTEAEGGASAEPEETGIMSYVTELKKHLEGQPEFEGWKKFAKTWDVDEKNPLVAVNRNSSIQNDWNKVLKDEAKVLPVAGTKKKGHKKAKASPIRGPGGRFVSNKIESKKEKVETQVLLPPEPVIPPPSDTITEEPPPGPEKKKFWEILK